MENLNQIKFNNKSLYLKLDSLSQSKDASGDDMQELLTEALGALNAHKAAIENVAFEVKKRKNSGTESISKKLKTGSIFSNGDSVAVKVGNVWILAIVDKYLANIDKYSIIDAEDSKQYTSSAEDVIKIGECRKFSVNSQVLALFPGSSCFYNAQILKIPTCANDNIYTLLFEDDNGMERTVESRFVLKSP
jgi:hypothetical protein